MSLAQWECAVLVKYCQKLIHKNYYWFNLYLSCCLCISIAVCDSSLKRKQQWTIYFDEPNAEKVTGSTKCHWLQSKSSEMKPPLLQLKQLCLAVTGLALLGLYVRFVSKSHLGLYLLCLSLYERFVSGTHFGLYVPVSMSGSYLSPMSQSPSQEKISLKLSCWSSQVELGPSLHVLNEVS